MTTTPTYVTLGCVCGRKWEHTCTAWPTLPGVPTDTAEVSPTSERPRVDPYAFLVKSIVDLPSTLKAHRAVHKLSLRELARRSGVGLSTLQRIEHGEDFSVEILLRLALYLEGTSA
jgi:hypothetical protein